MIIRVNEAVISRKEDNGESFLFNTLNGQFKKLNTSGTMLWENCNGKSMQEIVEYMSDIFKGLSHEQLEKDCTKFFSELSVRGLISIDSNESDI